MLIRRTGSRSRGIGGWGTRVSETTRSAASDTVSLSVHGSVGVLDLVVPAGASALDVAREYAAQAGLATIPLLQTALGELLPAGRSLADAGLRSGDLVVAVHGVHRPTGDSSARAAMPVRDRGTTATVVASLAALVAAGAGWYAGRAGDDVVRTAVVALLLGCALVAVVPLGPHVRHRTAAAPAFGAAAAFAALYVPGHHLLPAVLGSCALAAAVVASVARAVAPEPDEATTVWMASGLVVLAACALSPLFSWDPRVSWTLLLLLAMMAARFAPALAIDVPDEALLDLDRLAVTAWSARDRGTPGGRRGRIVVAGEAMAQLVRRASRTVTASAAAVLVVVAVSAPLLLHRATLDLDRIGARLLVFLAGASILLAARSYRHRAARALLRGAGLVAWGALAVHLVGVLGAAHLTWFVVALVLLGCVALAAAVATGRGWRSVWWSRRAEVAESLCGSLAFAAAVVAAGLFRRLWEITS